MVRYVADHYSESLLVTGFQREQFVNKDFFFDTNCSSFSKSASLIVQFDSLLYQHDSTIYESCWFILLNKPILKSKFLS